MLRGTIPHDLAMDGDDKKVMGLQEPVPWQNSVKMSECSVVHDLCACSADVVLTQVNSGMAGWTVCLRVQILLVCHQVQSECI